MTCLRSRQPRPTSGSLPVRSLRWKRDGHAPVLPRRPARLDRDHRLVPDPQAAYSLLTRWRFVEERVARRRLPVHVEDLAVRCQGKEVGHRILRLAPRQLDRVPGILPYERPVLPGERTLFEGAVFPGHSVTDRDTLASSSRSQSSACGQVLRIASRPASAMTRGPSIVFA
jgi:hypothetical protein